MNVNRYTIIGIFAKMFHLSGKIFDCWRPIIGYAAVLVLCGYVFSAGISLYYGGKEEIYEMLRQSWIGLTFSIVYLLVYTHFILAFVVDFYDDAFGNRPFAWRYLWYRGDGKWRAELLLIGYIIGYILPFCLSAKLLLQETNPDWRIEFVYFCLIFASFIVILLQIRLSAIVSRNIESRRWSSVRKLLRQTSGSAYVGIVMFLVFLAFSLLCSLRLNIWLSALAKLSSWLMVPAEFADDIVMLGLLALMIVFCRAQDELLTTGEEA